MNNIEQHLLHYGIAIIGMAGRFPGANTIEQFWENISNNTETIQFFSKEELMESGISETTCDDPNYVAAKGVIENIANFDAEFFNINPREAELIDPQQRIFLECAWEVLEDAGYNPYHFSDRIGTFASASKNTYLLFNLASHPKFYNPTLANQVLIANEKDYVSTRTAYKLNLNGPCVTVQTACSSSLIAVHLACQSLMLGECEMALAGGVSIDVPHKAGYLYQPGGIFSPDGHCRVFDTNARGTVFSQGAGIVLLKPLVQALNDNDNIYAVIRGSATNNDGGGKTGFTAPSVAGQSKVITDAIAQANVDPRTISFIETHGTGTMLGDPIEVEALKSAFSQYTNAENFCALGSVKANIGHLNSAAGVVGLIKAALSLKNNIIPACLHYTTPNVNIDFSKGPFYVSQGGQYAADTAHRAGVSSFGIGGSNVHAILEESPKIPLSRDNKAESQLIVLSARSLQALAVMKKNLVDHVSQYQPDLESLAFTLQEGRCHFAHRYFAVCQDITTIPQLLSNHNPLNTASHSQHAVTKDKAPNLAFFFSAGEKMETDIALKLYQSTAIDRTAFNQCNELIQALAGINLTELLLNGASFNNTSEGLWLLFAIEYALARQWQNFGVEAQLVFGQDIGEYVAACVAGVLTLEDALKSLALSIDYKFKEIASSIKCKPANIAFFSCFLQKWITETEIKELEEYYQHGTAERKTTIGIESFPFHQDQLILDIGLSMHSDRDTNVPTLFVGLDLELDIREAMLIALGKLWLLGIELTWSSLYHGQMPARISLPTYPFERKRYWIERRTEVDEQSANIPIVVEKSKPLSKSVVESSDSGLSRRDMLEQELTLIFKKLLGVEHVTRQDDFFELGGHSLLGAEFILLIKQELDIELPLNALLNSPTVETLADFILNLSRQKQDAPKQKLSKKVERDLQLDDHIMPPNQFCFNLNPDSIFLTGATGFLGTYLLHGLLECTNATVYCLVRSPTIEEGLARLQEGFKRYDLSNDHEKRIQPVLGDLSQAYLGMSEQIYQTLADKIDVVYHCGARLSFIDSYAGLRKINVEGTRQLIEFCCKNRTKHLHYVSSIAAYDCDKNRDLTIANEDLSLEDNWGFHSGYDETKWVAEMLVTQAGRRGIPITIYRPGNISGDSRTGFCSADDLIGIMIRGCIDLQAAPNNEDFVDVVPIDYVSRALVYLSSRYTSIGESFNLVNPAPSRWIDLVGFIKDIGYPLKTESFANWCERLKSISHQGLHNVLTPLLPMFYERPLFSNRMYSSEKTNTHLKHSGIGCHVIDKQLFQTYIDHLVKEGVLSGLVAS